MLTQTAASFKRLSDCYNLFLQRDVVDLATFRSAVSDIPSMSSSFSFEITCQNLLLLLQPLSDQLYNPCGLAGFLVSKTGLDVTTVIGSVDISLWIKSSWLGNFVFVSENPTASFSVNVQDVTEILLKLVNGGVETVIVEKKQNQSALGFRVNGVVMFSSSFAPVKLPPFPSCQFGSKSSIPLPGMVNLINNLRFAFLDGLPPPLFSFVGRNNQFTEILFHHAADVAPPFMFKANVICFCPQILFLAFDYLPVDRVNVGILSSRSNSLLLEFSLGIVGTVKFVSKFF